jgi:8-oxo-dGTP pyrophosphatase MutT (NUDIX family)
MPPSSRRRDTARVILASPDDQVLLFRHFLPAPWSREGWLTPGGAIDPGETPAQAAARELAEETGHQFLATGTRRPVAVDSGQWQAADGTTVTTTVGRAGLLQRLLAGDPPHQPLRLPWT